MPKLLFTAMDPGYFTDSGFTLAPLIVLNATLDLTVKPGGLAKEAVQAGLLTAGLGFGLGGWWGWGRMRQMQPGRSACMVHGLRAPPQHAPTH